MVLNDGISRFDGIIQGGLDATLSSAGVAMQCEPGNEVGYVGDGLGRIKEEKRAINHVDDLIDST